MKIFTVVVSELCSCHYMEFCHHGPYLSEDVAADSKEQIKNMLALPDKFDVWIKEQEPIDLDQLAALADEVNEQYG